MYAGVPITAPVCVRTEPRAGRPGQLGDAEVEHLDALVAATRRGVGHQEDVVGLEIAVDDAARRARRQARSAICAAMRRASVGGSAPEPPQPGGQALALEAAP